MHIVSERTVDLSWALGNSDRLYVKLATADPASALAVSSTLPAIGLLPVIDASSAWRSGIQIELTKTAGTGSWPAAWAVTTKIQAWNGTTIGAVRNCILANDQGAGHPGPYILGTGSSPTVHDVALGNAQMLPQTVGATGAQYLEFALPGASALAFMASPLVVAYLLSFTPSTTAPTNTHTLQLKLTEWTSR